MLKFDKVDNYFLFSDSDVALIIKYHFHDAQDQIKNEEEKNKKRKILLPTKRNNIMEYSSIKLPAPMFAHYLQNDCQSFIRDCKRCIKTE